MDAINQCRTNFFCINRVLTTKPGVRMKFVCPQTESEIELNDCDCSDADTTCEMYRDMQKRRISQLETAIQTFSFCAFYETSDAYFDDWVNDAYDLFKDLLNSQ